MTYLNWIFVFSIFTLFSAMSESAGAKEDKLKLQILITNVKIFDGKNSALIEQQRVFVEGNLIKSIGRNVKAKPGTKVIDGRHAVLKAVRLDLRRGATQTKVMVGGGVSSDFDPLNTTQCTSGELRAAAAQLFYNFPKVAAWARKHDVFIVSGGDTFGSNFDKRNIENIIVETDLDLGPYEALLDATGNPGKLLKDTKFMVHELDPYHDGMLGVIAPGAYAGLLIVDGNPLEESTVLRDYRKDFRVIMKDGAYHKNTLWIGGHDNEV